MYRKKKLSAQPRLCDSHSLSLRGSWYREQKIVKLVLNRYNSLLHIGKTCQVNNVQIFAKLRPVRTAIVIAKLSTVAINPSSFSLELKILQIRGKDKLLENEALISLTKLRRKKDKRVMEIAKNSQKPLQTLNKKNWLKEGQKKRIKCHRKCALDGPKSQKKCLKYCSDDII